MSAGQVIKMAKRVALQLTASPEQRLLDQTVGGFFKTRGLERLRVLRDDARAKGEAPSFSRVIWRELSDLGVLGLLVPENKGGMGQGMAEVVLVCEAEGRVLAPEPLVGSAVWATSVLTLSGDEALETAWFERLISGEAVLAVADEDRGARVAHEPTHSDHGRLFGEKVGVLAGAQSDAFIVTGLSEGEAAAWLVPKDAPGLTVNALDRVDAFPAANLVLAGVPIDGVSAMPIPTRGLTLARERATIALCAEMVGAMSTSFETTLGYLDERVQFGVKIGTFQALRHRAARAYIELELAQTAVSAAAALADRTMVDSSADDISRLQKAVSLAKSRCSEAFELIAAEGIQMAGGIGMTDEHTAGFFFTRARVAAATLGDAAWHRDRWARLSGY